MTMTAEDGRADGVRIGLNGIPLNLPQWPVFPADEQAAAQQVLASGRVNYWTGDEGAEFEREFAAWNGTRHALALANGTLALELALHAFGIGAGADVVTTPRTFIASASAVVARGGRPVFADVDPDSGNITADTIRAVLTPETRAVIVVHLAGWPADMDAIMELADEHGLVVIEDCAQAHGAEWNGRRVGSIGHAGAWSFCQDKIMTTAGEGGMLTLNDDAAFERAWSYRDHGKDRQTVFSPPEKPGYRYLSHTFGTNWRLSEVQAAVGRLQLQKLPGWLEQRRRNALTLTERFADVPGLRVPLPEQKHAFYKL
ncbi:MAG TPA: DegT/DnrJ/EryC1/StrS family aminotransferase, partial [Deinococcales bacterium]|nr:DegT/DnrJ/EryC1/StrS family aminotransferase [Deinococcales bacterium]